MSGAIGGPFTTALRYDKQLIVVARTGGPGDQGPCDVARALQFRAERRRLPSCKYEIFAPIVKQPGTYATATHPLDGTTTARSRIYVLGHGDWQAGTLGSIGPDDLAWAFRDAGLLQAKVVSVVSCKLGTGQPSVGLLKGTSNSFAARFHMALRERGLNTVVYARTTNVTAIIESDDEDYIGAKRVEIEVKGDVTVHVEDGSDRYAARMTKIEFYWAGDHQRCAWVT
jgi:hypothetical protein